MDPTPEALDLLADGALSVNQAVQFSGISRAELFGLMKSGHLAWFKRGVRRFIVRRTLVEYLARLYAAHKAAQ
jgi:hypothetical protein